MLSERRPREVSGAPRPRPARGFQISGTHQPTRGRARATSREVLLLIVLVLVLLLLFFLAGARRRARARLNRAWLSQLSPKSGAWAREALVP